jgi:cell division septum initiation protein DivIVA
MNVKDSIALLRIILERQQAFEDISNIQQEIKRLESNRDTLLRNIRAEGAKEAEAKAKEMVAAARTQAKELVANAQTEVDAILKDARTKAAAYLADGEQRLRGIEEGLVLAKAKELLASKAAA